MHYLASFVRGLTKIQPIDQQIYDKKTSEFVNFYPERGRKVTINDLSFEIKLYKTLNLYRVMFESKDDYYDVWNKLNNKSYKKRFSKGTKLMLWSGESKLVEDITEEDVLMGDDSTPRHIKPDSLVVGIYKSYSLQSYVSNSPILHQKNHFLTLQVHHKPKVTLDYNKIIIARYCLIPGKIEHSFVLVHRALKNTKGEVISFKTKEEANLFLKEHYHHVSLTFECNMKDFVSMSKHNQRICQLFQPLYINFPQQQDSLKQRLERIWNRHMTKLEILETAWVVGMWLTDGDASRSKITQIGNDIHSNRDHTPILIRLQKWCNLMFLADRDDNVVAGGLTTSGNIYYRIFLTDRIKTGDKGKFRCLLEDYGIFRNKHFPLSLLTDQYEVRKSILAGVIDGDGYLGRTEYEISGKEKRFLEGVQHLCRGLGYRSGKLSERYINFNGKKYLSHRIHVFGNNLTTLSEYISLPYKHSVATSKRNVNGFYVKRSIKRTEFIGFILDGNGRCLRDNFHIM